MAQEVGRPAIRSGSNFIDEQTCDTIAGIVICEGEVYGSLDLPAELPGLAWRLPAGRPAVGLAFVTDPGILRAIRFP